MLTDERLAELVERTTIRWYNRYHESGIHEALVELIAARAILREIAAHGDDDPHLWVWNRRYEDSQECRFCGEGPGDHQPDCLWLRVRRLLAGEGGGGV